MEIKISHSAEAIIKRLNSANFEAYAVGGCVRDSIMGREVTDVDITTSALPQQIKSLFSDLKVIETGIKHGTVTLLMDNCPFEVTTYRTESSYTDSRHPDKVTFVSSLFEDLSRRDFTINSIAFSPSEGIIDPFGGLTDIENKTIRTVGDPLKRFSEDALRILRALRFSSTLGFEIEEKTSNAILSESKSILKVSPERIYSELQKLLCGENAQSVINKYRSVLLNIMPINNDVSKLNFLPLDIPMRLTYLCGANVINTLDFLRSDKESKRKSRLLLESQPIPENETELKLYVANNGRENSSYISQYRRVIFNEDNTNKTEAILKYCKCLSVSELDINGNDLLVFGLKGKEIKNTLEKLLVLVVCGQIENKKEELIQKLKDIDNLLN